MKYFLLDRIFFLLKFSKEVFSFNDEKLSNFLSSQLNTQSSILQLINKINEQGILDSSTKKIFDNLNKNIQEFNKNTKK